MMEKENTFIGKDDLIHCSVCKEPKQAWLPENDLLGVRLRYRQCACERDANAIEKAEQEEKERRVQIAKNRQNCFDEATMKNKTFANTEEMTPAICKAKKYVDNWDEMKQQSKGLLFWGPLGTGKTYVAACIANALLERNVTVKMTNFNTIVDTMFRAENKTEYMNELSRCSLLIIDELGLERSSEYALGIIFDVIDHRYRSGKPLITTTNLPLKEIKGESNINKRRIYDRILERCTPILVDGENKREKTAEKNMKYLKTIFEKREIWLNHAVFEG